MSIRTVARGPSRLLAAAVSAVTIAATSRSPGCPAPRPPPIR